MGSKGLKSLLDILSVPVFMLGLPVTPPLTSVIQRNTHPKKKQHKGRSIVLQIKSVRLNVREWGIYIFPLSNGGVINM